MLTIRPPPAARMCGSTSREQRISENSFTSRSATQVASFSVSKLPGCAPPALLTRQSIPPNASAERATRSRTCSGSVTSAACAYSAPMSAAVARISSSFREQVATRAPSATSSRAIASPRPFDPPVTSTRRPSRPSFTSCAGTRRSRRASPAAAGRRCRRRACPPAPQLCGAATTAGGALRRRRRRRPPTRPRRARSGACPRGCRSAARSRASAAGRCSPRRGTPARASSARSRSAAATDPPSAAPLSARPSGNAWPSQERSQLRDPLVDASVVDEAEREPDHIRAAAVREEERARDDPDAVRDGAVRELDRVDAGKRQPGEEAALRRRPLRSRREGTLERREHALALPSIQRPRPRELLVDPAAAGGFLEEPLPEGSRALVGQLLRCYELCGDLGRADGPAQPHAGAKWLRGRARLDDDVGAEAPEARQRLPGEPELAIGNILDDQEPVPARQLDERRAAVGREADAGRVLVVGDRVEELGAQAGLELTLQLVDLEPVLVERHCGERRLEAPERLDRAEVGGAFDDDDVTGVEVRLPDQLERLDRAARDQELVVGGPATLQPLEPVGERVQRPREPSGGRVLERAQFLPGGELLQQRRDPLARERLGVGKAAGERDQVGKAEQREHRRDPLADLAARPRRGERLPPCRLGSQRHAANPMPEATPL